jgi:hypothetical protein
MKDIPAFPRPYSGTSQFAQEGMTLRDYFAAKAMTECIGWGEPNDIAVKAYKYADAMMKAREA